jgi:hypothetical protein
MRHTSPSGVIPYREYPNSSSDFKSAGGVASGGANGVVMGQVYGVSGNRQFLSELFSS